VIGHAATGVSQPSANIKLVPRTLDEAIGVGNKENPNVVAALYREEAARYTVDRIWGELLPEFRLEAQYSNRYDPSRTTDQTENTTVTGRVNVPIYQGGEVHARVRQAKHTHVSRLQEIEQARSETQATVVSAWSRMQASKAQLQSDQAQVAANQTALAGVREEERVGQRTLLDVLNAEQELLNSQVQLAATQRDLVVNTYSVIAAVGRLSVQELGTNSVVYDPEVHYHEVRRQGWGVSITYSDGRREHFEHGGHKPAK
jgi:outer membrane protein